MEIEIQMTRKSGANFLRYYHFRKDFITKSIIPFLVIVLISYNLNFRNEHSWSHFLLTFLAIAFLFFLFRFYLPYVVSIFRLVKRLGRSPGNLEIDKISLISEGVNILRRDEMLFYNWNNIKAITTYKQLICLTLFDRSFYLLPTDRFQSDTERDFFLDYIQNELKKAGPQNVNQIYNKGWLGLIPLVGAFVGIWLVIQGVSKYKDKKLIIIGIAALSFTVAIYLSMIYYFQYSEQYRKDFAVFSQPDMNSLVKSIEFYKIQNGSYPDSLEELTATDKMVIIHDPILAGKPVINKGQFYYKKMGNRYSLFSSGVDRIPHTDDDLLPSSDLFDSTKTGLIRPKP